MINDVTDRMDCVFLSLCLQTSDWTEDELSLLSRLMVKFPGGSPGRWEKIAHELGRSVSEVSAIKLVSNQFMINYTAACSVMLRRIFIKEQ